MKFLMKKIIQTVKYLMGGPTISARASARRKKRKKNKRKKMNGKTIEKCRIYSNESHKKAFSYIEINEICSFFHNKILFCRRTFIRSSLHSIVLLLVPFANTNIQS